MPLISNFVQLKFKEFEMKKFLCSLMCAIGLGSYAFGASVAGFEISPELGLAAGKTQVGKDKVSYTDYSVFGRVWLGAFDFVVAPQFKYDFNSHGDNKFRNLQYGVSAGYNIGLVIARLTPYVGINRSSFNQYFKDTTSYNAGLKLKFDLIPISFGLLYTYQNPEFDSAIGGHQKMQTIQALLGLHF